MAFLPFFHIYGQVVVMIAGLPRGRHSSCSPPDIDEILVGHGALSGLGFYGVPPSMNISRSTEDRPGQLETAQIDRCGADTLTNRPSMLGKADRIADLRGYG